MKLNMLNAHVANAIEKITEERDKLRDQLAVTQRGLAQLEPALTVIVEPDYVSSGHFYHGSKPHISASDLRGLPIGTKLYTEEQLKAVIAWFTHQDN